MKSFYLDFPNHLYLTVYFLRIECFIILVINVCIYILHVYLIISSFYTFLFLNIKICIYKYMLRHYISLVFVTKILQFFYRKYKVTTEEVIKQSC